MTVRSAFLAALLAGGLAAQADRVLFLTHSQRYEHAVVKRPEEGGLSLAERRLRAVAAPLFDVRCTKDCSRIEAAELARHRAVVFYTSGALPIDGAGRRALLAFVRSGGAFVGIHSAAATLEGHPPYGRLLGGVFDGHPWHQEVRVTVAAPGHPAVAHLESTFTLHDEIYQFRGLAGDRRTLLALDLSSVDASLARDPGGPLPLAWTRAAGRGRVFYTALGHREEVWRDERYLRHVLAGLLWAAGGERAWRRPPPGAEVLVGADGAPRGLGHGGGVPLGWQVVDGGLEVVPGTGSAVSRRSHGDAHVHVEFRLPQGAARAGRRGNSGVYLQRRYEVQILETGGGARGCAALYGRRAPDVDVTRPPGAWQTFDVVFRAARFDSEGRRADPARVTVVHNGHVVHLDVPLAGKTGAGDPEGPDAQPLLLQDHGARVRFRNVWVRPL